jgi:hypothetical protein
MTKELKVYIAIKLLFVASLLAVLFASSRGCQHHSPLAINGGHGVSIVRYDTTATQAGDLVGGAWYMLTFDGTYYRLQR